MVIDGEEIRFGEKVCRYWIKDRGGKFSVWVKKNLYRKEKIKRLYDR